MLGVRPSVRASVRASVTKLVSVIINLVISTCQPLWSVGKAMDRRAQLATLHIAQRWPKTESFLFILYNDLLLQCKRFYNVKLSQG